MSRAVEVHATIAEARCISDDDGIHDNPFLHSLSQGLDAIEHTSSRASLDRDTLLTDCHHVTLLLFDSRRDTQFDITHFLLSLLGDGKIVPRHLFDILFQKLCLALQLC